MKPRQKTLAPLRLDYSGATHPVHGVTLAQIEAYYPRLAEIRDAMLGEELEQLAGRKETPEAMQPLDAGFVRLPQRLLEDYESNRRESELGRLFRMAHRLHSEVDAVVVLGIGGSYMGAKALMDACCQPYWNELDRGDRGSRPRIYFEGNNLDNDATQGLLHLLRSRSESLSGGSDDPNDQWGLVAIRKSGGTIETAVALRQFLEALDRHCQGDRHQIAGRVVAVTGASGKLAKLAEEEGWTDRFEVPDGVGGRFSVLSPVGLVPAALLGLNVIELLGGAVAMTRHFEEAPPEENIVLQWVAVHHALQQQRGIDTRVLSVWSKALEATGWWYDQLAAESLGKQEMGFTPVTIVSTRDLHSRHQQHEEGTRDKVIDQVVIDQTHFDPLRVGKRSSDADRLNDLADRTLPELLDAAVRGTNQALWDAGRPTTTLHLPCIDELHLGQFFQMMMLATVVEGRLMGINPYGQPGVEGYKRNMSRLLGRKG
ncbi:MAG: glucose-6-phosphate isomerase [Pirellulaceae bacterium]